MNALNKVEIENTFRIAAPSAIEAAKIAAPAHLDFVSVEPIAGSVDSFIVVGSITTTNYYHAVFVELASPGKYRVEVGSVKLSELEYTHLIGGDDAVNEIVFYHSERDDKFVTADEYNADLAHWVTSDIKEGTPGRMESYVKRLFKKVIMVNGKFQLA